MARWPEWHQAGAKWIPRFQTAMEAHVPDFLATLPENHFPPPRKRLAMRLLQARLEWLRLLFPSP